MGCTGWGGGAVAERKGGKEERTSNLIISTSRSVFGVSTKGSISSKYISALKDVLMKYFSVWNHFQNAIRGRHVLHHWPVQVPASTCLMHLLKPWGMPRVLRPWPLMSETLTKFKAPAPPDSVQATVLTVGRFVLPSPHCSFK